MSTSELRQLNAGQALVFGGNQVVNVSDELAEAFQPGDRLVIVNDTGDVLHIPEAEWALATTTVTHAYQAFLELGSVDDEAISRFFELFANRLADDACFAAIAEANQADVAAAKAAGRSTTRLELGPSMRADMVSGLRMWASVASKRDKVVESIEHDGWRLEQRRAGLGVVGFVFEGRPNVFADACGVLRSGNTVAFRIGSAALGTARAIVSHALGPALDEAGLPAGSVSLIESAAHAAGWALFSDPRLALAIARGSGAAVAQLGAVARQAGIPISLHGTGGGWIIAGEACDADRLEEVVASSLDRKVCNTLNTCCILRSDTERLVPRVLAGLRSAATSRSTNPKVWVTDEAAPYVDAAWFAGTTPISRAEGESLEPMAERISADELGREWEWEGSPEITLHVVETVEEAVELFNVHSPRFVASLISNDQQEQDWFWRSVDAPFVGDGFTRWVDGQYALNQPELGLSNWANGRLFGRGGVLSGDSVFTVRSRVYQADPSTRR